MSNRISPIAEGLIKIAQENVMSMPMAKQASESDILELMAQEIYKFAEEAAEVAAAAEEVADSAAAIEEEGRAALQDEGIDPDEFIEAVEADSTEEEIEEQKEARFALLSEQIEKTAEEQKARNGGERFVDALGTGAKIGAGIGGALAGIPSTVGGALVGGAAGGPKGAVLGGLGTGLVNGAAGALGGAMTGALWGGGTNAVYQALGGKDTKLKKLTDNGREEDMVNEELMEAVATIQAYEAELEKQANPALILGGLGALQGGLIGGLKGTLDAGEKQTAFNDYVESRGEAGLSPDEAIDEMYNNPETRGMYDEAMKNTGKGFRKGGLIGAGIGAGAGAGLGHVTSKLGDKSVDTFIKGLRKAASYSPEAQYVANAYATVAAYQDALEKQAAKGAIANAAKKVGAAVSPKAAKQDAKTLMNYKGAAKRANKLDDAKAIKGEIKDMYDVKGAAKRTATRAGLAAGAAGAGAATLASKKNRTPEEDYVLEAYATVVEAIELEKQAQISETAARNIFR